VNTASPSRTRIPGRAWALTGFLLGSAVSVGGNLQAAWLPADNPDTPAGWAPSVASQVGAIVWPLALMVSVEVLSRIAWPDGWGWRLVRVSGLIAVAGGSGVISYGHIHAVLTAWGYGVLGAAVGPLVVDGLMLISGFALVSIGRASRTALDTSQEAAAEPPATPSHTPIVPAHPTPSGGQEHAVPVTPIPPDTVTGTAPQEAFSPSLEEASQEARPKLRSVPSQKLVARPPASSRRAPSKTAGRASCSDAEVFEEIASYASRKGELPSANWLKTNVRGLGADRAKDLLEQYPRKQEVTA